MNQKDYKAIAEIIKGLISEGHTDFHAGERVMLKTISRRLADYFERENKSLGANGYIIVDGKRVYKFNKKQFLRDCGVG